MVGKGGDEGPEALKREQRRLLDEMTALEEDYEAGTIDQKTYSGLSASCWKALTDIQRRINATKPLRTRTQRVEEYRPTSRTTTKPTSLGVIALGLFLVVIGFVLISTVVEKPTGLGFSIPTYEYRNAGLTLMTIGAFLGFAGFVGHLYFNYQNEVSSYEYLGMEQQPQYPGYGQPAVQNPALTGQTLYCQYCGKPLVPGAPYCPFCRQSVQR